MELTELKGVGKARLAQLEKLGIFTVKDLLEHYPLRYQDCRKRVFLSDLVPGQEALAVAEVLDVKTRRIPGGRCIVTAILEDDSGRGQAGWFNQAYVGRALQVGQRYILQGKPDAKRRLQHPDFTPAEAELPPLLPIYRLTAGLSRKVLSGLIRQALDAQILQDELPAGLRLEHGLAEIGFAMNAIHYPRDEYALELARRRLAFQELLLFQTALLRMRSHKRAGHSHAHGIAAGRAFTEKLPFRLTGAQARVLEEIYRDMAADTAMQRLVQGDVGSGKTVVAFAAMAVAAACGRQAVMMAPTEVLARQHYATAAKFLEPLGYRCCLLVGSLKEKEKRELRTRIANGEVQLIFGTQALIQQSVTYREVGLVVADEQHRFGVRQRGLLGEKGGMPDYLFLSATPIPRTLSMILYGEMEVSAVDELPPGRLPVMTRRVPEHKREDMYGFLRGKLEAGGQGYVICARVEAEEEEEETCAAAVQHTKVLQKELVPWKVACLHGRMTAAEKEKVLGAFAAGEVHVLVSTTVVEVGVDVPNANVMIVENAERFGLAQLHQLRGRVGRGKEQAYCFLMSEAEGESTQRLDILTRTNDGFRLAQADLELRGPGDWLGVRQSGAPMFRCADIVKDMAWLTEAREAAQKLLALPESDGDRQAVCRLADAYADARMGSGNAG